MQIFPVLLGKSDAIAVENGVRQIGENGGREEWRVEEREICVSMCVLLESAELSSFIDGKNHQIL